MVHVGLLALAILQPGPYHAEGDVAARLNDEIVTWRDVDERLASMPEASRPGADLGRLRRLALRQVAEERLFQAEADKRNLSVSDADVDEEVVSRVRSIGGEERFDSYLRFMGMTREDYRERVRTYLLSNQLIRQFYSDFLSDPDSQLAVMTYVSPSEVEEYYNAHRGDYTARDEVVIQQIVIRARTTQERDEARRTLESVLRRLEAGSEFFVAARHYSDPDADPEIRATRGDGHLDPETERLAFETLQPGRRSGILERPDSLAVVQLQTRSTRQEMSYFEAYPIIHEQLRLERWETNKSRLLRVLVGQAYIWPEDLFSEGPPDAAGPDR